MVSIKIMLDLFIIITLAVLLYFTIKKKSKKFLIAMIVLILVLILSLISNFTNKNNEKNNISNEIENSTQEAIKQFEQMVNNNSNKSAEYKGIKIKGLIEIPSIGIKYPIFETSSNVPITLLYGTLNKTGNAVIDGVNHKDGKVFSNLKAVKKNDSIFITDSTGVKLEYIVYDIYKTDILESAKTYENKNKIITLSTVNDNGTRKIIVKAKSNN